MVAFTKLWGFDEPLLLASTFFTPTDSSTARTGSGRADHDERTAETELLLVGNRTVDNGDLHKVLLCVLHAFGDGRLNLRSLAQTVAYDAVLVTDDDNGRETECTTSLGYLGNTLNAYESVLKLEIASAYFLYVGI